MKGPSLGFSDVEMTHGHDKKHWVQASSHTTDLLLVPGASHVKKGDLMLFIRVFDEGQSTGQMRKQMSWGPPSTEHSCDSWRQPLCQLGLISSRK